MNLHTIIAKTKLTEKQIVAAYMYGSRVYGTFTKHSDYDFIVVTSNMDNKQFSDNLININFYTPEEHQQRLYDHEISAIECQFLEPQFVLLERQNFKFRIDHSKLRHSLSAKSSNSWVKAKKKLTVEKDYDLSVGRKSLFHAIRIVEFGIQLAEKGKIYDYGCSNPLFEEIMNIYNWDELFLTYKNRYNNLLTRFRVVAPKEI